MAFGMMIILLVIAVVIGVSIGPVRIPLMDVVKVILGSVPGFSFISKDVSSKYVTIVLDLRFPIVTMALFVGAGLSSSGASMQGLFKNPLVDPFIIGISAGGAFGWVLGLLVSDQSGFFDTIFLRLVLSFIFAMGTVVLAYLLARTGNSIPLTNLLLAGVALSAALTAATQLFIYLFVENPTPLIFSLMGSCSNSTWSEVAIVGPVVIVGSVLLSYFGKELNAFSIGEEGAKQLGVEVERAKIIIIGLGTLVAAISIPFCGMVGFVGLIIPHIVRRLIGPDHRFLIPGSALFGASFLIICDLFSRSLLDVTIPLGIVTGLIGGVFFLYLLRARRLTK
jgi:iron complex transport system permease protein